MLENYLFQEPPPLERDIYGPNNRFRIKELQTEHTDISNHIGNQLVYDTPLDGLRISATFDTSRLTATGHFTEGRMAEHIVIADFDKHESTIFSVEYSIGNTVLVAEHIRTRRLFTHRFSNIPPESFTHEIPGPDGPPDGWGGDGPPGGDGKPDGPPGGVGPDADINRRNSYDVTADGWYVGVSHQFSDWLQLSGYYSESYNDTNDRSGGRIQDSHRAYLKDVCLTTGFILNDAWHIKVEGHRFMGTGGVSPLDQAPDESGEVFTEDKWSLFAVKVTFNF
jgi:hypothetical protein